MFDWSKIESKAGPLRGREIVRQITESLARYGTVDLEDAMTRSHDGGDQIMAKLVELSTSAGGDGAGRYKFKVIYTDTLGTLPQPGAKFRVSLGMKRTFIDTSGIERAMNTKQFNSMVRTFAVHKRPEDNPYIHRDLVLDDDCCVTVDFQIAFLLMRRFSHLSGKVETITSYKRDPYGRVTDEVSRVRYNWLVSMMLPSVDHGGAVEDLGQRRRTQTAERGRDK